MVNRNEPNKIELHQLFLSLQEELTVKLTGKRRFVPHAPTKGTASENDWIRMLKQSLPVRYCVDTAFIVDSRGELSEQQDVVIYDRQYSPLLFNDSGVLYIPAESVYAVFEVKQEISKEYIEYAAKKAASVRRRFRTNAPIVHAGGEISQPRPLIRILAGVLCLDSEWKPCFGEPMMEALKGLDDDSRLDLGCVLMYGGFETTAGDDGNLELKKSDPNTALIFFFLRLLHRLQRMATVPAIDLTEYGKAL